MTQDTACRQITKIPSAATVSQHSQVISDEQQQQPPVPRDCSKIRQVHCELSAQKPHTGLQSRAAQMVMQQRQAHLQLTSNHPRTTMPKGSRT